MSEQKEQDLKLKELDEFIGSENYYQVGPYAVTDGVKYIMENGYSWLVTDAAAVITTKGKNEPFVVIKLKLNKDGSATVTYDDGNENILYQQKYEWTDAKREVKLYYDGGVLMLPGEY